MLPYRRLQLFHAGDEGGELVKVLTDKSLDLNGDSLSKCDIHLFVGILIGTPATCYGFPY